jgi:GNAT superfamily N-acetyltransferase
LTLQYETLFGAAVAPHLDALAALRIRGFRAFPYLYEGTVAYERRYLEAYLNEPRGMLIRVTDGGRLAAAATAVPLASSSDIVADGPRLFRAAGYDPATFYYYAEILVEPAYRGRGIAAAIYAERERWARRFGYTSLCLAVVERDAADPRRPKDYVSPERIWIRDGFTKTAMTFTFAWPTVQVDGRAVEQPNTMRFWMKPLS